MDKTIRILIFAAIVGLTGAYAYADEVSECMPPGEHWKTIRSEYFTIYCHPGVKISKVEKKVKYSDYIFGEYFCSRDNLSVEEKLAAKVNYIMLKVKKILNMNPEKMHLNLVIFSNQRQLRRAVSEKGAEKSNNSVVSCYIHNKETIYTTQKDISRNVLVHEIAHAVCDHYFIILPPPNIKEVLSQYVEMHFEE